MLALIFLVPLAGSVRDFLQEVPDLVADLRESGELDALGDTGAAENVQQGADYLRRDDPRRDLGAPRLRRRSAFSIGLALFTVLFLCLFLLIDIAAPEAGGGEHAAARRRRPLARGVGADHEQRLALGDRGVTIACIAGTVQGTTAWLLGSSYALALGVIAGLLDLIPNLGATIAGFILVPDALGGGGR